MPEPMVPAPAALCFEYAPFVLEAVEKFVGCYEALAAACADVSPDDDELMESLLDMTGADDLAEILAVIAGRVTATLGPNWAEPIGTEEATSLVAELTGRYSAEG